MVEPTVSPGTVTDQGTGAPADLGLDLGPFQRDEAPLTLAMSEGGQAPDAQTQHGEGIRSGPVVLDSVEYDERGEIVIGGQATPNAPLNIYVDNEHVGSAIAGQTGRWSVTPSKPLSQGVHYLRVDQVESGGRVVARVELPFARVEPIAVEFGRLARRRAAGQQPLAHRPARARRRHAVHRDLRGQQVADRRPRPDLSRAGLRRPVAGDGVEQLTPPPCLRRRASPVARSRMTGFRARLSC